MQTTMYTAVIFKILKCQLISSFISFCFLCSFKLLKICKLVTVKFCITLLIVFTNMDTLYTHGRGHTL